MQLMSEDDAAYSALLAQLLSDSANSRNARVHSWIEHQYDFVLSEQPSSHSPPPSPSPSSSLGAHRGASIDRPDSPLLPRSSYDRTSSPCYDALFFPSSPDDDDFEEKERVRALRFIVQEMAHWKSKASQPHTHDKVPVLFFFPSSRSRPTAPSSSTTVTRLDLSILVPPHALTFILYLHLPSPLLYQHALLRSEPATGDPSPTPRVRHSTRRVSTRSGPTRLSHRRRLPPQTRRFFSQRPRRPTSIPHSGRQGFFPTIPNLVQFFFGLLS